MVRNSDDIAVVVVRERRFYRWLLTKGGVALSSGREATAVLANIYGGREKLRVGEKAEWMNRSATVVPLRSIASRRLS